jgi:hypothetical protein
MNRTVIPLKDRKMDIIFVVFFIINLFFITYVVDIEQLTVPDPYSQQQPAWPPAGMIKIIHTYGANFDPLLMARPQWWKDTIWLDVIFYGPFYLAAIYAFLKGKEWIRVPALVYSGMMFADVFIILGEEIAGPHASPRLAVVLLLNAPWLLLPLFLIARMWKEHPFTVPVGKKVWQSQTLPGGDAMERMPGD